MKQDLQEAIKACDSINDDLRQQLEDEDGDMNPWIWAEVQIDCEGYVVVFLGEYLHSSTQECRKEVQERPEIGNGSYYEPMEPGIEEIEGEVVYRDGMFTLDTGDSMGQEHIPLIWDDRQWTEVEIKDAIATSRSTGDWWDNVEEGDLGYLLEEYKLKDLQELIEYLSGIQVIGNVHDKLTTEV